MRRRKKFLPVRKRYRFTKADCQLGYRRALEKCMADWDKLAWFHRLIRGHYRKESRNGS